VTRRKYLLIPAALALIAGWVFAAPFLATSLIVEKPLERADLIVVLSGSAAYKERTQLAAQLYAKGVAPLIAISDDGGRGPWSSSEQANPRFVDLAHRELLQHGVAETAILQLPGEMTGTNSEAKAVSAYVGEQRIRSVLLVTSPYHTYRAYNTFMRWLSTGHIEVGIVSHPPGGSSPFPETWWIHPTGWRDVAGEYVKSPVYWLFY
jgi:uncharacterized SAM-binding protein YcdF (DUF218 family)